MSGINHFIDILRSLGSAAELKTRAELNPVTPLRLNAHVHLPPNFSAFSNMAQAVELASEQKVDVLGASNYYDYTIYASFAEKSAQHGIFPVFGLEIIALIDPLVESKTLINDPGNFGKMYICGKGIGRFSPMSEKAVSLLQVIRDNDGARMEAVAGKLADTFAKAGIETGLTARKIREKAALRTGVAVETVYLQERHLAQAFQEALFENVAYGDRPAKMEQLFTIPSKNPQDPVVIQNEIRSHLMKAGKPAFAPDTFVNFDHAYQLILALGGIPCYPTLADGTKPICGYESPVSKLIKQLNELGIPSAEFIPNRNTPEVLSQYVHALRDAGLVITAGTEHNTLDLLPLEPTCLGGAPIPEDVQEIFREGVCVVIAHQYLTLMGLSGFVEADGTPNPQYSTAEERINGFSALGGAVLSAYRLR